MPVAARRGPNWFEEFEAAGAYGTATVTYTCPTLLAFARIYDSGKGVPGSITKMPCMLTEISNLRFVMRLRFALKIRVTDSRITAAATNHA